MKHTKSMADHYKKEIGTMAHICNLPANVEDARRRSETALKHVEHVASKASLGRGCIAMTTAWNSSKLNQMNASGRSSSMVTVPYASSETTTQTPTWQGTLGKVTKQ